MYKYLLFIALLITCDRIHAQISEKPKTVQSPNASTLGIYGDVPVSLFTGLPTISIPLHTLSESNINVPISLNYHASGFRPDEHPGWVGMGWNLNAGGSISRVIKDYPDEYTNPRYAGNEGLERGFYYSYALLNVSNWNTKGYMRHLTRDTDANQLYYCLRDTEPDEFSFNFLGYSGKFYLDHNRQWKVKCDKPLKIELNTSTPFSDIPFSPYPSNPYKPMEYWGYSQTFTSFTITAEDGTRFIFGGPQSENAIEYSIDMFNQYVLEWQADTWNLTKIISADGREVTFKYTRSDFICQMYSSISDILDYRYYDKSTGLFSLPNGCGNSSRTSYNASFEGKLISPVYLSEINTSTQKAAFSIEDSQELRYENRIFDWQRTLWTNGTQNMYTKYGPLFLPFLGGRNDINQAYPGCLDKLIWKKLRQIKITSINGQEVSYSFGYSNSTNQRLTLLSLQEIGKNGLTKPSYEFTYKDLNLLPKYLVNKNDHWGYFNNKDADSYSVQTYKSDRDPINSSASDLYLAGMLTGIKYPTGGSSKFEYEQHRYSKQLQTIRSVQPLVQYNSAQPAGGVRIRKISKYTYASSPVEEREYYYVHDYDNSKNPNNLTSSGILGGQIQYYFEDYLLPTFNNPNGFLSLKKFSSQSVLPSCHNSQGSHVGYSEVVEKRTDGSYTRYLFSNFIGVGTYNGNNPEALPHLDETASTNSILQESRLPYEPSTSLNEERGKLVAERSYNSANILVKETTIDYLPINKSGEVVRAIKANNFAACAADIVEEGTAYQYYTYSYFPSKQKDVVYDVNGLNPRTAVKEFLYYDNKLLQEEKEIDSKQRTVRNVYRYADNFLYPNVISPSSITEAVASMRDNAKHIVSYPIEKVTYLNGVTIGAEIYLYKLFNGNSLLKPYQRLGLEVAQPINYNSLSFTNNGAVYDTNLKIQETYPDYDAKGNLLAIQKQGNTLNSYQWGYNKSLLVAKTDNAVPSEVFSSSFEEDKMVTTAAADVPGTWNTNGYLKFEAKPSDPNHPSTRNAAHTGQLAGAMYTNSQGEQAHAFSTTLILPAQSNSRKYVFSGWVYTNGPAASIWLFPNLPSAQNADGTINYYDGAGNSARPELFPSYASTEVNIKPDQIGRWAYLQKEVEIPGDATLLTLRITNFWNGAGSTAAGINGGGVWFDDVRMHPAEAQMTTYTHQLGVGITSMSDPNNQPTYYEYDGLQRLQLVKDLNGNIVKHLEYHYQR